MPSLTIKQLKGKASIQDLGRNNAQHMGFSGSGAADEFSFLLANHLIGNSLTKDKKTRNNISTAAFEVTLGQLSLVANNTCKLVITGADCQSYIRQKNGETLMVKNNQTFELSQGDEICLGIPKHQLHSYIAIEGGFSTKTYLNSASQTVNEYALELGEAELKVGKQLHYPAHTSNNSLSNEVLAKKNLCNNFHQSEQLCLRFLPNPVWLQLTSNSQQFFLNQLYQITSQSNRMGYRLLGDPLRIKSASQALSKPINYGTIQLPDDGQPIVLMKERQTIGGYPTLGTVIQTDLFRLSQKRPGEKISFIPATLEQAQAQLLAFYGKFILNKNQITSEHN